MVSPILKKKSGISTFLTGLGLLLVVLTSGIVDVPVGKSPFGTQRMQVEPQAIAQPAALARLSTHGVQNIVTSSGHLMQHAVPEAILKAIRDLAQIPTPGAITGQ